MSKVIVTLNEIPEFSKKIAASLQGGEVLGLIGELGSGKTTFTQALAKELHIARRVTSPTFVIHTSFSGKLKTKKKITLHHLDIYRLQNPDDLKHIGLSEFIQQPDTVTVIEWADKFKKILPKETTYIYFT